MTNLTEHCTKDLRRMSDNGDFLFARFVFLAFHLVLEHCVIMDYLKREDMPRRSATMGPISPPRVMFHNVKTPIIFCSNCLHPQVEVHSMEARLMSTCNYLDVPNTQLCPSTLRPSEFQEIILQTSQCCINESF